LQALIHDDGCKDDEENEILRGCGRFDVNFLDYEVTAGKEKVLGLVFWFLSILVYYISDHPSEFQPRWALGVYLNNYCDFRFDIFASKISNFILPNKSSTS